MFVAALSRLHVIVGELLGFCASNFRSYLHTKTAASALCTASCPSSSTRRLALRTPATVIAALVPQRNTRHLPEPPLRTAD
eukprot:5719137-Heterocapsa_arctica.AAC.1